MDKRSFLKNAGLPGLGSMIGPGSLAKLIASVAVDGAHAFGQYINFPAEFFLF